MSCRETKANSALTSLAQAVSELPDRDVQSRFHALKREGADAPAPDVEEYREFLARQRSLLSTLDEVAYTRRRSIEDRLDSAFYESRRDDFTAVPDGSTFYALKNIVADTEIAGEKRYVADLTRRLPTMEPTQVDTELADRWDAIYRMMDRRESAKKDLGFAQQRMEPYERTGRPVPARMAEDYAKARTRVASYDAKIAKLRRRLGPYDDEYERRGRWSRFYETTGSNSHIHSSMSCSTCFPTTRYGWHPSLSGRTEDEAVAEFGEKMCTVCFPSAPTNPAFHGPGRRDRETQAVRQAERDARAAEKAAKAIAMPDGRPLRDALDMQIKSLVTAKREYVSHQAYLAYLGDDPQREGLRRKYREVIANIEDAIAHKTGQTVAQVREEAAPKVKKKVDNGEW